MKIFVIVVASMVYQVSTNEQSADWSTEAQKNELNFQIDDKTTILHLSNTVNVITSSLVDIITKTGATYADDLERLIYPLEDIISFVWSTPLDETFQENLYFLFDKILDIVYCIYEILDEVWHEATQIIESKLSQISMYILRIVDQIKTLSDGELLETNLKNVNETIVDLTMALVGLTTVTTSIVQLVTTKDRSVTLIVGTIASLIIIHEYAVSAVACLLSRAIKLVNSLDLVHAAGIPLLEATIVDFISSLQPIVMNNFTEASMTELFHGDLHGKLSMELLASVNGLVANKMIDTIYTTTTHLLHIVEDYATQPFHVLADLMDQLTVILFRCGHTEFVKLEPFITYAFDGLCDVLHHISYKLDKDIQSSASTGSFPEPSEPIDVALANVRTVVKRFISDSQHISESNTTDISASLIASTRDLMKALLDPTKIVIHKSDNDFRITLVSTLQFITLYAIGLVATPFIAAVKSLQDFSSHDEVYENFGTTLSLAFIKIQMIFDYSELDTTTEVLERLDSSFEDLFQDLTRFSADETVVVLSKSSANPLLHLF